LESEGFGFRMRIESKKKIRRKKKSGWQGKLL